MSNIEQLLVDLYTAADAYDESIVRMRREGTIESVAAKNAAWSKLQSARSAIQNYIRR